MKILSDKKQLIKLVNFEKNLGFVPTMGGIHKGHLSLINKSISECEKTIVSIYINKPQFNKKKDFVSYPRNIKKDLLILKKYKIDYLFIPKTRQIYPNGPNKRIKISALGNKLCGRFRPNHFEAIADVVDRFLKIIKPKKIYMGEKDMQQLKIIEDFVKKNHKNIKVIGCKIIREKNGIAYSSRNFLINKKQKKIASNIYKLLKKNKKKIIKKQNLLNSYQNKIKKIGAYKIDYLEVLDINKLVNPFKGKKILRIFIAYYVGSVRLIDNI